MLTEQDYREVLMDLRFDVQPDSEAQGHSAGYPKALRHRHRRFTGIRRRTRGASGAFWPTLYWMKSQELVYFRAATIDVNHFQVPFWLPAPHDRILEYDRVKRHRCFVPAYENRQGLKVALQTLMLAEPDR